jgi:diguanylate cyclase (GGDEF)-like protein
VIFRPALAVRWGRVRAAPTGQVGGWPVWQAPAALRGYLLAVVALAVAVAGRGVVSTPWRWSQFFAFGLLVGCGIVALEATRRSGEPAGVSRDLLSGWTLPIALLLPPVYALLAPAVLTAVTQLRVKRGPVHRRVFSAAVIGLEGYGRASVFQLLAGGSLAQVARHGTTRVTLALLAALGIGFVFVELNAMAVAVAVRLNSPEVGWRQLLGRPADAGLDLLELTVGTVIAAAWLATPAAAVLALPAMVSLHRALIHDQLLAAARTDAKTGLLNAGTWQEEASREILRATRTNTPLTVMIADLDHFKEVNDRHGHVIGDQVLAAAAAALRAGSRSYDLLGRFGGEEFVILLPNTDADTTALITERLRQQVAATTVPVRDSSVRVTVSIGVAVLGQHGTDVTDLLIEADLALYRAKAAGRNQVSFASGE